MADEQTPADSPDVRARRILGNLLEAIDKALNDIEAIAQQEIDQLGKDTPQGNAWWLFAGRHPWSDWNRAYFAIHDQIMAVRGSLTVRGLDSNRKDYMPLNSQAAADQTSIDGQEQ